MSVIDPGNEDTKTYFDSYRALASTLRTWLVAYGIGAPVLFASQSAFAEILKNRLYPGIEIGNISLGSRPFYEKRQRGNYNRNRRENNNRNKRDIISNIEIELNTKSFT